MADVTKTIHVEVKTFDPLQAKLIPVEGATLLCEDSGWLWDPDLSTGTPTTDASGKAAVSITYDAGKESKLNPFFTITIPSAKRKVPSGVAAKRKLNLPDEWETRHYVKRRIPNIASFSDPAHPLELFVGLEARLRISYSDFDSSGKRNPMALPEDSARAYLADYDTFLWIDWLNPDDTMTGFGGDPVRGEMIAVGPGDRYAYFPTWPLAPYAFDGATGPALDPPGTPVGVLGGGSFEHVGPLAVDPDGFVLLVDGSRIRRFYPDGTLCETITDLALGATIGGLALDRERNLYVSDTDNGRVVVYRLDAADGPLTGVLGYRGRYEQAAIEGGFAKPGGLAVVRGAATGDEELLAVADTDHAKVQVFAIQAGPSLAHRADFGSSAVGPYRFSKPAAVAADAERRLWVADRALHRVTRWGPSSGAPLTYTPEILLEKKGGGAGAGDREFDQPTAIAVDRDRGYVYVAETGNKRVQRLHVQTGVHLAHWAPAPPFVPAGLAVDDRGDVYIADSNAGNVARSRVFAADGSPLAPADVPLAVGAAWTPRSAPEHMRAPEYVAFDPGGRLWVSDTGNNRVLVFERGAGGRLAPAAAPDPAGLDRPMGVAVDGDGNVFVVDSGHHRVRKYGAGLAHEADFGSSGSGDGNFSVPHGIAVVARGGEQVLAVADRNNSRVELMKRDGTFVANITTDGAKPLSFPEDVAADADGNLYVADTLNKRIVVFDKTNAFVRQFAVPKPGSASNAPDPTGIALDDAGKLVVTDRARNLVLSLDTDGTLIAFWDLQNLLRQTYSASPRVFAPELARQLVLDNPARAAVDGKGLLAIADTRNDRVRLLQTATDVHVNLFDLGEGLPDISLRVQTKADWKSDLGLKVNVGDVSIFDDSHEFVSKPEDDFSLDRYERRQILGPEKHTNAAVNVLHVTREVQRWYQHNTRASAKSWGREADSHTLDVDLEDSDGSCTFLDVNLGHEGKSPHGRGADSWDDSVVAHEMSHWVFGKVTFPYPILPLNPWRWVDLSRGHEIDRIEAHNQALSEGWAEYAESFWGSESQGTDRVRGWRSDELGSITFTDGSVTTKRHLFGGLTSNVTPNFQDPERGLQVEGYLSNALYQLHHALADPAVGFADAPSYWHRFNAHLSDEESDRYAKTIWKALFRFKDDPPFSDRASTVFMTKVLDQVQAEEPAFAETAHAIYELNNQLMPVLKILDRTSGSPGTEVGDALDVTELEPRTFALRLTDATGRPLAGYNVRLDPATPAAYAFAGAGRAPKRLRGLAGGGLERATDADGVVTVVYQPPPLPSSAPKLELLTVSYQPNFDDDSVLAPPQPADTFATALRRLYLHALRGVNKLWSGSGNNFGAKVSKTVQLRIVPHAAPASTHYTGRLEDASAAPENRTAGTGHQFLGSTAFTVVDRTGATVHSDTTAADGTFSFDLPATQVYELKVAGYDGLGG